METKLQNANSPEMETGKAICENCGKELPATDIQYSDIYCKNLCTACQQQLAKEMEECDKELAALNLL